MPSLASKLMPPLMRLRGSKKIFSSAEATLGHIAELALRPVSYCPPRKLDQRLRLGVTRVHGWPVYEAVPLKAKPTRCAIYVHGGAWIREITAAHWRLIADLATATGTRFLIPIYPLAPTGTAGTVIPQITELAVQACAEAGAENTFIMGDSAGGSIALAVAMQLRDQGHPPLRNTLLISPALDLNFSDPLIDQIEPLDPMLAKPGVQTAASLWKGDLSLDHPLVSPMFGELAGLGPLTLFSGTHDAAHADARRFAALAKDANLQLHYQVMPGMLHVYPLMPIPEGRQARNVMKAILAS
ncbi:alpha/beta hydrolase fold domain-containing protein [Pseudomonas sp. N040]|uniref:alpha/beta hydrolase fold domain-containing protein n=1 Tax=Pseudomonas sp. N040 TaxID=2785325 RepID=UPI0018A2A7B4|nr:alpha/beta hydrolase [Pseudomonas sp. N040]MBF7731693.1 alpha/beta hydrolase fold domain-containing protein [Pseudomonas sp. N040]MBW7015337.1 alpha/beta hydrolase [Pseudomonas sp. N040]